MSKLKDTLKNNEAKGSNLAISKAYAMKQLMVKMKGEIVEALPSQVSSERFQKVALTAFNSNQKL